MQFIDLKTQYELIEADVVSRVTKVLASQRYIMGPEVAEAEEKLAEFAGTKYCVSCGSGTDALVISLMALGLKKSDAVFVPAFTFFASGESVTLAGGTPVFVDSDSDTYNMSVDDLKRAIKYVQEETDLTPKGIIPVDLFGQPADYDEINEIATQHGMFVLEDAAQGFGSTYHGKRAGSLSLVGATSFFPAKPLGCYGDGGAIFTDDADLCEVMKSVRVHGQGGSKYDNVRIGINGRFDTIQAAIILSKLTIFENEIDARQKVAAAYNERLSDVIKTPVVKDDRVSVWAQYTLEAKSEAEKVDIQKALTDAGIPSANYYPIPMHLSTAYAPLGYKKGDLPVCERQATRVFSLPMHPYLKEEEIATICDIVRSSVK
ncbi:MAG: DegT/DnrJ/EryC1/StrS family aminotransferase [Eggerthellaceae bacterium]|nr:DegT/DnrJ/EryC1/StrS family aminotransferase [Eggerthellaceae bacterium]